MSPLLSTTLSPALRVAGGSLWLVLWLLLSVRVGVVVARMYQIEEYEARRLWAWANARAWNWHRALLVSLLLALAAGAVAVLTNDTAWVAAEGAAGGFAFHALWRWVPPKKELVWTPRMRRMFATASVLAVAMGSGALVLVIANSLPWAPFAVWLSFSLSTTIPVVLLIVANGLMAPVEARVRRGFIRRAAVRMAEVAPVVVAVAGSWGKTSTKHILAALLPPSAAALPTPKSFNTLLGVTRAVNDLLEPTHKTFIVEMDAYAVGEIAAICDLVHPGFAVITAVGPQHMERFGSVERIADALYETVACLPTDGVAVIHGGDPLCADLARRARADGRRAVTYAAESEAVEADILATAVRIDEAGSHFQWTWAAENIRADVTVPLLGAHQILNVSAALAIVHLLGHDVSEAVERALQLQPVEHRLQPLPTGNGITVIDDSYNANPVGVHNGLDVLSALGDGQKILVTPGLVELGSAEEAENRRYGAHAADVCDQVIVMRAKTSDALLAGLRDGGLEEQAIHVVGSLSEATDVIAVVARKGDVVLFANDLPDTYLS